MPLSYTGLFNKVFRTLRVDHTCEKKIVQKIKIKLSRKVELFASKIELFKNSICLNFV